MGLKRYIDIATTIHQPSKKAFVAGTSQTRLQNPNRLKDDLADGPLLNAVLAERASERGFFERLHRVETDRV